MGQVELDTSQLDAALKEMTSGWAENEYADVLELIASEFEELHQTYFDNRQSPTGEAWPEWQWRPPWGPESHPTLEVSKTLRGSLKRGRQGHIEEIADRMLRWGTNISYAALHNFGATIRLGIPLVHRGGSGYLPPGTQFNITQREFVGLDDDASQQVAERIADAAVDSLRPKE